MIKEYDLILLVEDYDNSFSKDLVDRLKRCDAYKQSDKKICIFGADECKDMISLYYTYEYSDKVKVVGRSRQYGGLFNLVEAGLITYNQAFEAILR